VSSSSSDRRKAQVAAPGVSEAVSWQLADDATRTLALQTLEVFHTRDVVAQLATRYASSDNRNDHHYGPSVGADAAASTDLLPAADRG
jgi:hypothetical protein